MNFKNRILMNEEGGGSAGASPTNVELTPEVAIGLLSEAGYKVYQNEADVQAYARTILKDPTFFAESVAPIFDNPESDFYKSVVDKRVGPEKRKVREGLEQDILAATGVEQKPNEKTHLYLKRAFKDVRTADLTKIEEMKAAGNQSDHYEKEITDMQRKWNADVKRLENERIAAQSKVEALTFEGVIANPLSSIRGALKEKGFAGAALDAIIQMEKQKLSGLYSQGLLKQYESAKEGPQWRIYKQLEGDAAVPAHNDNGKALTLDQFFADSLEKYTGSLPKQAGANLQEREVIASDKSSVKINMGAYRNLESQEIAKMRLLKDLNSKGLSIKEANAEYRKLSREIETYY